MANITNSQDENGNKIFNVSVRGGEQITLNTKDTYVDKNIQIKSAASASGDAQQVDMGIPQLVISPVQNNQVTILSTVTNEEGYIAGGTVNGQSTTIHASDLTEGTVTITTNGIHSVINQQEASVAVPPCIYSTTITFAADDQRTASFVLPAQPRAWFLVLGASTGSATTWDNVYRCASAYYDGSNITWFNRYKRNGNNTPYLYKCENTGVTQNWNESNKTLTLTVSTAGNLSYAAPFSNAQYQLFAILDNQGTNEIYIK